MLIAGLTACSDAPLLSELSVEPAAISPNRDGDADVTRIAYRIGAPALVTIELEGSDGQRHLLRDARRRSPGEYEAFFGGVIDGRMLPDDVYRLRVSAQVSEASGVPVAIEAELALSGGDSDPPQIQGLSAQPATFTPNQDGLGDRVAISYSLDEEAQVRLWLEHADGRYETDILEEVASARFAGQPGAHTYDYDAGVDADAPPPPDGEYRIVAEARDQSGNVTRSTVPLEIRDGGQPRVALSGDVVWSSEIVPLGETLGFTITVQNIGATPIRTFGPAPGFVYDNRSSFNMPAPEGFQLLARQGRPGDADYRAASARIGPELRDASPSSAIVLEAPRIDSVEQGPDVASVSADGKIMDSADKAVRAESLASPEAPEGPESSAAPGSVESSYCGQVVQPDGKPAAGAEVFLFFMDGDRGRRELAGADGRFCFPDLPWEEAARKSYSRSPGAVRLGIEYDEKRSDLPYPYRWQLGPTALLDVCDSDERLYLCLPPGAVRQIFGGIRFNEAPFRRNTAIYLALEHEDVRRIQGPYGVQRITVESP